MRSVWLIVLLIGCYDSGLPPLVEEVPIVARPFTPCDNEDVGTRVACVIDGDTLDIRGCGEENGERIRLLGD